MKKAIEVWTQLSNYPGLTMKATITSIICVGHKELYSKKVSCINAWDFPEWEKDINDDSQVCKAIYDVLKDADAVVTHNGRRFDWKHLQTRLLANGLPPLPNIIHVDTCQIAKKNLLSFNNKLGYLGEWLLGDTKLDNGGWQLWLKVSQRVKSACKMMEKYCKQDVVLLEKLFLQLRPFIKNLPNRNIGRISRGLEGDACPTCGSTDLRLWGFYYTKTGKFQRVYCNNCNSTCRLDAKNNNPRAI